MVTGMISILIIWALLFTIFFGIGCLIFWVAGRKVIILEAIFTAFWLGWAITITVLQLWHLFAPVNSIIFSLICCWAGLVCSLNILRYGLDVMNFELDLLIKPRNTVSSQRFFCYLLCGCQIELWGQLLLPVMPAIIT